MVTLDTLRMCDGKQVSFAYMYIYITTGDLKNATYQITDSTPAQLFELPPNISTMSRNE